MNNRKTGRKSVEVSKHINHEDLEDDEDNNSSSNCPKKAFNNNKSKTYRLEEDLKILKTILRRNEKSEKRKKISADQGEADDRGGEESASAEKADDDGDTYTEEQLQRILAEREAEQKDLQKYRSEQREGITLMRKLDMVFLAVVFFSLYAYIKYNYNFDPFAEFFKPRRSSY